MLIEDCKACKWVGKGRGPFMGTGSQKKHGVMLIKESFAEHVSIDRFIKFFKIDINKCYITSYVKCLTAGNDLCGVSRYDISACRFIVLQEEIRILRPRVLVYFGVNTYMWETQYGVREFLETLGMGRFSKDGYMSFTYFCPDDLMCKNRGIRYKMEDMRQLSEKIAKYGGCIK